MTKPVEMKPGKLYKLTQGYASVWIYSEGLLAHRNSIDSEKFTEHMIRHMNHDELFMYVGRLEDDSAYKTCLWFKVLCTDGTLGWLALAPFAANYQLFDTVDPEKEGNCDQTVSR